jgi:hypothetical protein
VTTTTPTRGRGCTGTQLVYIRWLSTNCAAVSCHQRHYEDELDEMARVKYRRTSTSPLPSARHQDHRYGTHQPSGHPTTTRQLRERPFERGEHEQATTIEHADKFNLLGLKFILLTSTYQMKHELQANDVASARCPPPDESERERPITTPPPRAL